MKKNEITNIDRFAAYTGVILALFAIWQSCQSNQIAEKSFDLAKETLRLSTEERVFVDGEWTWTTTYLSNISQSDLYSKIGGKLPYSGVHAYVRLKITNMSQNAISIDMIKTAYNLKNSSLSLPWGKKFLTPKDSTDIELPITIQSGEPLIVITRIPILIGEQLAKRFMRLPQDSMYSNRDLITATGFPYYGVFTLPEHLITYSDSNVTVQKVVRGDRAISVTIRLSSGTFLVKTLDYIDINRNGNEM